MKIEEIWKQVEKCQTYEVNEILEIMWIANYSSHRTFGEIQTFIEKWDVSSIENALEDIEWIPTMESGEEFELTENYRYPQSGDVFRELDMIAGLEEALWRAAKPKKRKFF